MRYTALRCFALAVAVCLSSGNLARADYIASFNFTPDAATLYAKDPSLGYITLSNQAPASADGPTTLVATNITTFTTGATSKNPAIFDNVKFGLTLFITDIGTGATNGKNPMYFTGTLSGKVTPGSVTNSDGYNGGIGIAEKTVSATTLTQQVGAHIYTVTIGNFNTNYTSPGNPTSGTVGSLGAVATIKVSSVPEPSTMVLACMALTLGGGAWWYRRRRPLAINLA